MAEGKPLRVGIMGFGQTGRQLFDLLENRPGLETVAIADLGRPDILHYLLQSEVSDPERFRLDGNFLVSPRQKARLMCIDRPVEMPWDVFDVDVVLEATGVHKSESALRAHLQGGAPRVVIRTLPADHIDRIVIPDINGGTVAREDRIISAGSPTTTALCLLLHVLSDEFVIDYVNMTSVHAYTSDQALHDYAGSDYRRSRSAPKNIIPNSHEASNWLTHVLPSFADRVTTSALNVPVQDGCLLDTTLVFASDDVGSEQVNEVMRDAAARLPHSLAFTEDPIVSSDVLGCEQSLLFDTRATLKAGQHFMKTLGWYETRGHAARMLDVAELYGQLDHGLLDSGGQV